MKTYASIIYQYMIKKKYIGKPSAYCISQVLVRKMVQQLFITVFQLLITNWSEILIGSVKSRWYTVVLVYIDNNYSIVGFEIKSIR